jgi:hypothetical protein
MADNIRIVGNVNNTSRVTRINNDDLSLLSPEIRNQFFGFENDYIELFVYDTSNNLISVDYNYKNFKLPSNVGATSDNKLPIIEIDPIQDLQNLNYISGEFITQYNFQKSYISNPELAELFISEISSDRTEIRLNSTSISSDDLQSFAEKLIQDIESVSDTKYYIFNLSDNRQFLIINAASDAESQTLLLKLYEPLSSNIRNKENGWITEEIIEPYVFNINLDASVLPPPPPKLRGPNFDIDVDIKQNIGTKYENYNSLVSSLTGSSYHKVLNYMNDNSYDLNIDYTSFDNFIHFSSAKKRLEIFYSKVKQIENYNNDINIIIGSTNVLKNEQTSSIKLKIDDITTNFDGFERYLYFESGSNAWPKTGDKKPYTNKFINKFFYQSSSSPTWNFSHSLNEIPQVVSVYSGSGILLATQSSAVDINTISLTFSTTSSGYIILSSPSASVWYNNYTSSAASFDEENLDYLYNIIPTYIKNDSDNYQPYYNFIDMIGHYFDNIWIYITSINELYNADNNLEKGISKDIVYDALRSLGVKLYNSKGDDQFDDYIGGINSGSTLFTDDFSVTSSYLNNIPKKDQLAELYKRIYHNIPLLSKTKGTSTGLQNLITTFGITSSIFQPKEFGGNTKNDQLKGYNDNKITIQDNTITGSVLSPFISLQQPHTSSNNFTSTNLHFVDLSFSPQNQLNTRISSSIALLNPTFSLDQYIGDPRLMESSSYDDLIIQQNYFTSASAAISGSNQRLDYKGFIELVKYFDNSLFKMLKDFVPARANALTGVTIKSSVLERNKIPVYQPKVEENTVYEAEYAASTIDEDKSYYYDKLNGNKTSFYNGQITGSYVNVYSYFDDEHINPYLFPTESIDINKFNHTDFNITLNNISSSIVSSTRKKVEPLYTINNGKVYNTSFDGYEFISDVELQDSNLNLLGHKNSRYEGTKLSGLKLNTYSSASSNYEGDITFGKNPVIEQYTRKLGLFIKIDKNLFFTYPQQNDVFLKYLVDESGSLTELNKKNKNWEEVQNIFKSGDVLTVSQFDNSKNSDAVGSTQKSTDGIKLIYNSGYSYFPLLYNSSSQDDKLYFSYTGETLSKQFQIRLLSGGNISGSTPGTETYPIVGGKIFKAVDKTTNDPDNTRYKDGNNSYRRNDFSSFNTFSTYSISETGNQQFNMNFTIQVDFKSANQVGSFAASIKNAKTGTTLRTQQEVAASGLRSTVNTSLQFAKIPVGSPTYVVPADTIVYDENGVVTETLAANTTLYEIVAGGFVDNNCEPQGGRGTYLVQNNYFLSIPSIQAPNCIDTYILPSGIDKKLYTYPVSNLTSYLNFNLNTNYQPFNSGDQIAFELTTGSVAFTTNNFTASILPYNELSSNGVIFSQIQENQIGSNPFATSNSGASPFISGSISGSLVLNTSLTQFKDYLFLPSGSGFVQNKLYNTYGEVLYTFSPKKGDLIALIYGNNNSYFISEIADINTINNRLSILLKSNLPSVLNEPVYDNNDIKSFVFLTQIKDESNILLQFDKKPGATSLGFIIPNNIHPDVLDNIDTITKEVKQKLIDYSGTNPNF